MPGSLRALVFLTGGAAILFAGVVAMASGLPPLPALSVPAAAMIAVAYALERPAAVRQRRRANGLCVRCAYNLTGNVSGVCPECGSKVAWQ